MRGRREANVPMPVLCPFKKCPLVRYGVRHAISSYKRTWIAACLRILYGGCLSYCVWYVARRTEERGAYGACTVPRDHDPLRHRPL